MPGQQRIKRFVQRQPFVTNGIMNFQNLPRNYDYETLFIKIEGQTNIGSLPLPVTSTGFGPAPRTDQPFGLFPRIELIAEGRQTIFSLPGYVLGLANVWRRRQFYTPGIFSTYGITQRPNLERAGAGTDFTRIQAVTGAINFSGVMALDLQMICGPRAKDSVLRTGGLQTLELRLTTADGAALYYPQGTSTITAFPFNAPAGGATLGATTAASVPIQNCNVDVWLEELQELLQPGDTPSMPGYVRRFSHQDVPIPANNAQQEILLPTDNYLEAVIITPRIGGEGSDAVLNNVTLRRGVDVRMNVTANELQAMNERDYPGPRLPGVYIADLMTSGAPYDKISDAWNLQGGADTRLVLDVTNSSATTIVGVTTVEIIPLRTG